MNEYSDFLTNFNSDKKSKFIKTGENPVVSASQDAAGGAVNDVEKHADESAPKVSDRKKRTGYTGKLNTFSANNTEDENNEAFTENSEDTDNEKSTEKIIQEEETVFSKPDKQPTKIVDTHISVPYTEDEIIEEAPAVTKTFNSKDGATKDLPRGKGSLLRELAKSSIGTGENPDQLMMNGFTELEKKTEEEERKKEEDIEKELSKVREKRIKNFNFWSKAKQETTKNTDNCIEAEAKHGKMPSFLSGFEEKFYHLDNSFAPVNDEYEDINNRKEVFKKLIDIRKRSLLKAIAIGIIGIVMLIINLSAAFSASSNNGFIQLFGGNPTVYTIINIVFLVISAAITFDELKRGLFSFLKLHPKTDFYYLFIVLISLIQNIGALLTQQKSETDYHLLTGVVILLGLPLLMSKVFSYDNTRQCFKAVAAKSDKAYLRSITDKDLCASFLKEHPENDKNTIVYSGKTRFIKNFLKRSGKTSVDSQPDTRIVLAGIALSIIIFILTVIITKNFMFSIGALCFTACLTYPISSLTLNTFAISNENKSLSVKNSFIQSYRDVNALTGIKNIILDENDLFSAEITNVVCGAGVRKNQAEFCAAALLNSTGGVVANAFKHSISGMENKFPAVENLTYENKLGYSAWISGCRVLLGSEAFLINHNVNVPDNNGIITLTSEGCKPLYLAIEGQFAAVFSIKYSRKNIKINSLKALADEGTNFHICALDPNITDEFAEFLFNMPAGSVRITTKDTYESFSKVKDTITDCEETGIVFTENFESFVRLSGGAIKLNKLRRFSGLLACVCAGVGAIISLSLCLSHSKSAVSSALPLVLQTISILLCFMLPYIFSNNSKKAIRQSVVSAKNILSDKGIKNGKPEETENLEEESPEEEKTVAKQEKILHKTEPQPEYKPPVYETPKKIDFSLITGDENENSDEGNAPRTVSDEVIESFSSSGKRKKNKGSRKFSLLSDDYEDEDEIYNNPPQRKTKRAFSDSSENMPAPPRYDLSKKESEETKAVFEPPEITSATKFYSDDMFKAFEDDEIFSGLREENDKRFDF